MQQVMNMLLILLVKEENWNKGFYSPLAFHEPITEIQKNING